jgi:hypothetical protein
LGKFQTKGRVRSGGLVGEGEVLALAAVPAGVFLADVKAGYAQGGFGCLLAVFVFGWVFEGARADDHLVVGSDGRLVVTD